MRVCLGAHFGTRLFKRELVLLSLFSDVDRADVSLREYPVEAGESEA